MEDARIRELDNVCQSIAETRAEQAQLRADEASFETSALRMMRKHGKVSWRHAGVELVRVPGEEKLRVRTTKGGAATAEVEEEEPAKPGETAGEVRPMDEITDAGEGEGEDAGGDNQGIHGEND